MRCDIDEFRVKFSEFVYDLIDFVYAVAFERRKYLKGKNRSVALLDIVDDFHLCLNIGFVLGFVG